MANPTPIFVSPSTTIVQVNPLLSPYTPVILNSYSYTGQVVTIRDGTSSFGILDTPIVVSTASSQLSDGSLSTLLNQPQGTITAQAGTTSWAILNSFPFRNQYLSAGVQNLTVSTLFASTLSTLQEFTSSLIVENLFVSGNFSQSSPLVLNQTISTLGNVDLYSTITVWQSTFFSSGLSTLGKVVFTSSLTVSDNLITPSTVRFLSSVSTASGSVVGYLSTSLVRLGSTFNTNRLVVTESQCDSIDVGGSIQVQGLLETASTLTAGGAFTSYKTTIGSLSSLRSMAIAGSVYVDSNAVIHGNLSTLGATSVVGLLSVASETVVDGDVQASLLRVYGSTVVSGLLSTLNFMSEDATVLGNLQVDPTLTHATPIGSLVLQTAFGVGSVESVSTTIGGTLSTPTNFVALGSIIALSSFTGQGSFVTLASFSTLGSLFSLSSLSNRGDVYVSSSVHIDSNVTAGSLFFNQSNVSSTYIGQDLSILGNLTVTQTMKLSSISLVSSVLANSFETSTLAAGYEGIVSSVLISSLRTSSLGTGGILFPSFTMDMSNDFQTINLSTLLLSSLQFFAQSEGLFAPNTFFQATQSFGVNTIASTTTFDVNTIAYTLCNTTILKTLSTNAVFGTTIEGSLSGDGRLLSNVSYPKGLSTMFVETSSLKGERIHTDSLFVSTMAADIFTVMSTLTVGQIGIYGASYYADLSDNTLSSFLYIAAPVNIANLLLLNSMSIYGNSAGTVPKQVVVNSNLFSLPTPNPYTFAANSIRTSSIVSSNFSLPIDRVDGDVFMVNTLNSKSLYVSSSQIGLSPGLLIVPEGEHIGTRSTNTIETFQSTLIFNSTLFVSYPLSSVGINTFPYYTLDVHSVAYAPNGVEIYESTLVLNKVTTGLRQQNIPSLAVGMSTVQTNDSVSFYTQVQFFNNPLFSFTESLATPFVSYTESNLQINKGMKLDSNENVTVAYSGDLTSVFSTFFTGGTTLASGAISTNRLVLSNGFYLSMQSV
jgi:hypothetical protein